MRAIPANKVIANDTSPAICRLLTHPYLDGLNFKVDEPSLATGSIALNFKRSDRPDGIDNVVIPIARHVHELGGEYDGWGVAKWSNDYRLESAMGRKLTRQLWAESGLKRLA